MTGYSYWTPIWASRSAAIELSTGLTEETCTRTSTSLSAGVGSGRSSRRAAVVSAESRVMARMVRSPLAAHEAAADDELAGGAQDSERAPGHAQLAVVGFGDGLDLQLAVDLAHGRVERQRDAAAGGVKLPVHGQRVAVEGGAVGDEADLRVLLDVEEVARAQVHVALGHLGVQAGGLEGQLNGRLGAEVQRAVVVGELALDGHQAVEVAHVELDARPRRIELPGAVGDRRGDGRGDGGGVAGAHGWLGPQGARDIEMSLVSADNIESSTIDAAILFASRPRSPKDHNRT